MNFVKYLDVLRKKTMDKANGKEIKDEKWKKMKKKMGQK
jgi:hypothetical protein